jgi:hypothetical protein
MTRAGVLKAIKRGAISATRGEGGMYYIEPAELHRIYPPVSQLPAGTTEETPVVGELRARLAAAEDTVADLRRRLDREGEERRQAQTQLMALLADQRRPWWRFSR